MSKKGSTSITPVDPVATSNAQSAANIASAQAQQKMNMVNTYGPDGSVTYQTDANAPGGYSQTTSLSPGQQAIYDGSNQAQVGALGVANAQLGRVSTALGQSLNTSNLPALIGSVNTGGGYGQQQSYGSPAAGKQAGAGGQAYPSGGAQQGQYDFGGATGDTFGGGSNPSGQSMQAGLSSLGSGKQAGATSQYPTDSDTAGSKTSAMGVQLPGGQQSQQHPQGQQQAPQSTSYVQPGAMPSTSGIQSSFSTGGPLQYSFNPGQAVQGQVTNQDTTSQVNNAVNSVYNQATSRLDPQFAQSENALRTKLANQGLSQNDDAYQTALNNFSQGKNDAYSTAMNSAIQSGQNEQNTLYGQQLSSGQFANSAAAQQYAQNQGQAAFNNTTAGQDYSQNLGAANFNNAAQQQLYGQQAQNQSTAFGQGVTNAQLGLSSQNQQFNQGLSNAQLSNTARQQGLEEQAYIQNQPINQFSTLLGAGGQVAMPTGINYTPSQVANTDVLGAYALNQQGQATNAQMASQRQSGLMSGLFSLGAAALAPATGRASLAAVSDRRLKRKVRRIGTRPDGLPLYEFKYRRDPTLHVGVMAQEVLKVKPWAVIHMPTGYMAVDYGALDREAA